MLNARSMLVLVITLVFVITLGAVSACTTSKPVHKGQERPSADKVAREAGEATRETDRDELVLYSSSMEKAELEAGAEQEEPEAVEEAEEEALPQKAELVIGPAKDYVLDGETYASIDALQPALDALVAERKTDTLIIRTSGETTHSVVVDAISAARRAGFINFELRVDGQPSTPAKPADDKEAPAGE